MSVIARTICSICALPDCAASRAWLEIRLAWVAFSAFRRTCEPISFMELVICSSDEADSVAPCDKDWLASDT